MNGLLKQLLALVAAGGFCACLSAHGQTPPRDDSTIVKPAVNSTDSADISVTPPKTEETRTGRVLLDEVKTDTAPLSNVRPELPERPVLPPEVAQKLREFKLQREAYLRQRKEIQDRYRNATDAERAKLRERYRQLQDQWQNSTFDLKDQARERANTLKQEIVPTHERVIENARENTREQVQQIRERTGTK